MRGLVSCKRVSRFVGECDQLFELRLREGKSGLMLSGMGVAKNFCRPTSRVRVFLILSLGILSVVTAA